MTMTMSGLAIPPAQAGDFLRKAREYAGLTQQQLADELGLDRTTIRDAEKNVRFVKSERVVAWAIACGVEPAWLQWNVDACAQADMRPDFDLRACRDSNPKPSDLESPTGGFVNDPLTADRCHRSAWGLAA